MAFELADAHVTIVGLGLMGGSLAGALRGRCRQITGVVRKAESARAALDQGLVDRCTIDLEEGLRQAHVVILAMPVRAILQQLPILGPLLPEGCLLMDLGSTKAQIVAEMAKLPPHVQPLGAHPMCGKETSGLQAADPALYRGRTFILCPLPRTSPESLALGESLARAVGAHPLILEPERQDFLVGTVSHLPYLLACSLVSTADATTSADPAAWEIVAGGFRDTSRVAGSDVTMMLDILLTNRAKVLKAVGAYQAQLQSLADLLQAGDEEGLRARLAAIRQTRIEMFP
jgi:prephenate dehydrogenase